MCGKWVNKGKLMMYMAQGAVPRVQFHMDNGQFGNGVQLMP